MRSGMQLYGYHLSHPYLQPSGPFGRVLLHFVFPIQCSFLQFDHGSSTSVVPKIVKLPNMNTAVGPQSMHQDGLFGLAGPSKRPLFESKY